MAEKKRMEEEREQEKNRQSVATLGEKEAEKESPNPSENTAVASDSQNTALEKSSMDKKDDETIKTSSATSVAEVPKVGAPKLEV